VGTDIGGGRLGREQAVRRGRGGPEDRRVRTERQVARGRVEQQPNQPIGYSSGPHPGVHVYSRWQPVDPSHNGRQRHQSDRHGRRV